MRIAIAVVVIAQLAFTYAPFMHELFQTGPMRIADGRITIAAGVLLMLVLEGEMIALRWLGAFRSGP